MIKTCRLCQLPKPLRDSHVIPKFAIQWTKDTGPGILRQATNPNLRVQDGLKEPLLCEECEQLVGQDEKKFAERIFRPFLGNPYEEIRYDEFFIRFVASLAWRMLISKIGSERLHSGFDDKLSEAELEWRDFLLRKEPLKNYGRFHVFLTDVLGSGRQPIRILNQYLTRFTDGCVAMSKSDCAVYVKFSRFLFWAEITEFDQSKWVGTRIENGHGILKTPQVISDGSFGDFLLHRAKIASEHYWLGISERQQTLITDGFQKAAAALVGTDFWRSLQADMESLVDPHSWATGTIEPNELCPCGSGKRYDECHG